MTIQLALVYNFGQFDLCTLRLAAKGVGNIGVRHSLTIAFPLDKSKTVTKIRIRQLPKEESYADTGTDISF